MRVWVTRDEPADGPLSAALRDAEQDVIHAPVVRRTLVGDPRELLAGMREGDWLVMTSPFAIEAIPADVARRGRIAVVGGPSREAAERRGLMVAFTPSEPTGACLLRELAQKIVSGKSSARIWYPRSAAASEPDLPETVTCISPVLYDTDAIAYDESLVAEAEMIAFASPSAVRGVREIAAKTASIGPTTTAALAVHGVNPDVIAPTPSFAALARAIQEADTSRHQRA
ncbi:MAG: uroporphyrinogen-III synthase [Planctomycetes bacterium]|nr:uroporphyrinogen-III synthase [Planctomycetota bacterium]